MKPTWNTLPDYLIEQFPELKSEIEESYFYWSSVQTDPYPHFFLMEFLTPILFGISKTKAIDARMRAGVVLDELLLSDDTDLVSAVVTELIEALADNPQLLRSVTPYLGTEAKRMLKSVMT
jgi:hypothetical protein